MKRCPNHDDRPVTHRSIHDAAQGFPGVCGECAERIVVHLDRERDRRVPLALAAPTLPGVVS